MWRVLVRELRGHQFTRSQNGSGEVIQWLSRSSRFISSVGPAFSVTELSKADVAEVGWEFHSRTRCRDPAVVVNSTPFSIVKPSPLEESVLAVDSALCSLTHLPWLANQMWLMHWPRRSTSDDNVDGFKRETQRGWPSPKAKNFVSAANAIEEDESSKFHVGDVAQPEVKTDTEVEKNNDLRKKRQRYSKLYARQLKAESEAWQDATKEYKQLMLEMCRKNLAPNLPFVRSLVLGWFEPLRNVIRAEQKAFESLEFREHRAGYAPFLSQLPADMLAVITMHKLLGLAMIDLEVGGCIKVVQAASSIGEAVEQEVGIHKLLLKNGKKQKKGKKGVDKPESAVMIVKDKIEAKDESDRGLKNLQEKVKKLVKQHRLRVASNLVKKANGDEPWGAEVKVKIGCRLIELLLEVAFLQAPANQAGEDIAELRPAFKHNIIQFPGHNPVRNFGVIECDPLIWQSLDKSVGHMVMPYMPMLVKPRKWKGYDVGAHLLLRSNVMRVHGALQQREAISRTPPAKLSNIFLALDNLGSVGWRINTRVLDIAEKIWEGGGRLAEMVDAEDVHVPSKPETDDRDVLRAWRRAAGKAKRANCELHSLRCDTELKFSVARKMRNEEVFYYPHNLDFRGRAYPLHPHLNHLGSDMCRGILEFAEGRPLGKTGLGWLKVHLANVYAGGVDKLSLDARIAFVDENLDNVFDSAEKPLEGRRWWLQAEDPFQCFAACNNIRDAILSGNVEKFVSHLPVHQDGSCNGLQHYAALGRDRIGGQAVNLITGEQPADVYTVIAVRVRDMIEKEAMGDPATNPNAEKAKLLLNQIDRKLVKQTVMTSVYGVTFIGARNQILSRLKERSLPDDQAIYRAACYAAKVTIDALGHMFKEARCIMNWLGECAKIIALEGEPVKWTTPLGLPVVQPYRKPGRKTVKTSLQVLTLREDSNQPVAVTRQKTAFPPNFVHSLDGSHMMMTAIACRRAGLHFAGVHDSFWTHPGDVDKMNKLLRQKFVQLYSEPILENLLENFKQEFPKLEFPPVPQRGDLDLQEVLKSQYFFN